MLLPTLPWGCMGRGFGRRGHPQHPPALPAPGPGASRRVHGRPGQPCRCPGLGAQPDVQHWRGWGAAGSPAHAATTWPCHLPATCRNPVPLSSPPPDIDECAQGLHNCSQLCTNTPGAHACHCRPGFHPLDPAASQCRGEYLPAAGLAAHGAHPPATARRSRAAPGAEMLFPGVPCCAHSPDPDQPKT